MDIITQGVLGAATAQVLAPKEHAPKWALIGAVAGLAPDIDVLIRSTSDPLLFLDYHRHFTHSLAFIPVGAAVVALVLSTVFKNRFQFNEIYLPCLLGYATHGLLDACTSYGTYLYWPFSEERVAWNSISIVDPLFTSCLALGILQTIRKKQFFWIRCALVCASFYLVFGFQQHQQAVEIQQTLAEERGHFIERGSVKPSFGNNFLFRSYYQFENHYYVDAIRIPWWGEITTYEGTRVKQLDLDDFLTTHRLSEVQARDLERFSHFSSGYIVEHPHHPQVIGDLRYSFLPNSIAPLWGVEWSLVPSPIHTPFLNFRDASSEVKREYWSMLKGEELLMY